MNKIDKDYVKLLDIVINNYKNVDIYKYFKELEEIKKKIVINQKDVKYRCIYCNKNLSSLINYNNHIKNSICRKNLKNICTICNRKFTRRSSYEYHINNSVCQRNRIYNTSTIIELPQNITNNNNNNTTSNTTNNTTNNNIHNNQQNIIINVNNKDDIEEVCKQVCKLIPFRYTKYNTPIDKLIEYYNNPNCAIQKIVNGEHFNPEKPEQMNIHNTNCRSNRIQVFDADEYGNEMWITKDKMDLCEDLYEKSVNELYFAKNKLESNGIKIDLRKENRMNEKINNLETDLKMKKDYINKIADITWDKRKLVELNKKNLLTNY
jgi:hypothetical protein